MNVIDFFTHRQALGPFFEGSSWSRWLAILRAAWALPMSEQDLQLFKEVAGDRNPPTRPVRTLAVGVGRGGAKTSVGAGIAAFVAATGDFSRLRPGERGTIVCLACDREQAGIAFNYIAGLFDRVPRLKAMVESQDRDSIQLKNSAEIIVATNSLRAVRGRTYACAIYDECAYYASDEYANSASEVDAAISPGLARFAGSLKIMISSVHKREGLLYDRFTESYGKDDPDTLFVLGSTQQFNPTFDQREIDRLMALDDQRYGAELFSRWRDDLQSFLDRMVVENCTDAGIAARSPKPGVNYVGFVDASGGRKNSFTAAIAHTENNLVLIDALYEKRAPFDDVQAVVQEVAALFKQYGLLEAVGDNYAAGFSADYFKNAGIRYIVSEKTRSALYLDALPLFVSGRLRLTDNIRLRHQLVQLERRTTFSGRDSVGHPERSTASDDLANAACGAAVMASSDTGPTIWATSHLLSDNAPLPWPQRSRALFVTGAVDEHGGCIMYWSAGLYAFGSDMSQLLLVDYERGMDFRAAAIRAAELAGMTFEYNAPGCPPRVIPAVPAGPVTAIVSREIRHLIAGCFDADTDQIPAAVEANREHLLLAAATLLQQGRVKISTIAAERGTSLPNPLAEIAMGREPSAAQTASLLGVFANGIPPALRVVPPKQKAA